MNKREFVLGGCVAVAGGATSACPAERSAAVAQSPGLRRQRLPDLASDMHGAAWSAYVGHGFAVATAGASVPLTLREVQRHDGGDRLEQFTLRFSAAPAAAIASGTHLLSHATGQRVAVYLDAASHPGDTVASYCAHFSLLT